jgi:hypothetical protein
MKVGVLTKNGIVFSSRPILIEDSKLHGIKSLKDNTKDSNQASFVNLKELIINSDLQTKKTKITEKMKD